MAESTLVSWVTTGSIGLAHPFDIHPLRVMGGRSRRCDGEIIFADRVGRTAETDVGRMDYPLLNILWTMLEFFMWILWLILRFLVIGARLRNDATEING